MGDHRGVGFTGTQDGMSAKQAKAFKKNLRKLRKTYKWFRHGVCIGSDEEAHHIARDVGFKTHLHPPRNTSKKAEGLIYDAIDPPLEYIERNHEIVDHSAVLIATPKGPEELRSGTWSTVRYARKQKVPIIIIYPDGTVVRETPLKMTPFKKD